MLFRSEAWRAFLAALFALPMSRWALAISGAIRARGAGSVMAEEILAIADTSLEGERVESNKDGNAAAPTRTRTKAAKADTGTAAELEEAQAAYDKLKADYDAALVQINRLKSGEPQERPTNLDAARSAYAKAMVARCGLWPKLPRKKSVKITIRVLFG